MRSVLKLLAASCFFLSTPALATNWNPARNVHDRSTGQWRMPRCAEGETSDYAQTIQTGAEGDSTLTLCRWAIRRDGVAGGIVTQEQVVTVLSGTGPICI